MMQPDWYPADIIAGLRKREHRWLRFPAGRAGVFHAGKCADPLQAARRKLIADALETSPEIIWPSGYIDDRGNRTGRLMQKRRS
ncbi:helix-turn-helix domain-containing protein [Escherichia coli]|uniref:helix-turn-helix domain-containing protein n=1 Tax=Escherichia coli TaxID=562 RepID=UPI00201A5C9F|nr:helix-turn-helix domain-containing protein [Escherichia coli]MCL5610396.1 helix-turn-helix domain-containing protein [Escherichia coli]